MGFCGPGGTRYRWLNWLLDCLVPDNPFWVVKFSLCCFLHDKGYENPKGRTRREIDLEYLVCLLKQSDGFQLSRRYPARVLAGIYYTRVMLYGGRAWKRARKNELSKENK